MLARTACVAPGSLVPTPAAGMCRHCVFPHTGEVRWRGAVYGVECPARTCRPSTRAGDIACDPRAQFHATRGKTSSHTWLLERWPVRAVWRGQGGVVGNEWPPARPRPHDPTIPRSHDHPIVRTIKRSQSHRTHRTRFPAMRRRLRRRLAADCSAPCEWPSSCFECSRPRPRRSPRPGP